MSVCRKLADGTVQKIAGHTILLDANAAEIRQGTFTMSGMSIAGGNIPVTKDVTFSDPMPDTSYVVIIETESASYEPGAYTPYLISSKTVTGFHVAMWFHEDAATEIRQTCRYTAWKPVKLDGYTALQNKVNSPDAVPTEDSLNLVTSGGVYEAIKNASAVWKGTKAAWEALPAADKIKYDLAVLIDETLVKAVDREDGTETDVANLNKIFRGTQTQWDALTPAQKDYYDQAEIDDSIAVTPLTIEQIYPVGSVYINVNDVNPATILGIGTWERVASGKCLWGASADGEAGTSKTAGLPNIYAVPPIRVVSANRASYESGAISGSKTGGSQGLATGDGNADWWASAEFKFDASRSNPIYGNSNTVQPPALVVNIWQRTA